MTTHTPKKGPTRAQLTQLAAALGIDNDTPTDDAPDPSIPDLYRQLPRLDDQQPTDDPATDSSDDRAVHTPGPRVPINLTAYHLTSPDLKPGWRQHNPERVATIHRFGVLPALTWWTLAIEGRMLALRVTPLPHPGGPATVDTECDWLAGSHPFTLAQPWAVVYVRDLLRVHDTLLEAVTGKKKFRPRCADCHHELEPQDDGAWWKCPQPQCGRDYTPRSGLQDLGRRQPPMTGREIAATLRLPWSTLRTWDERGLIRAEGRDSRGRKTYYLADVKRVRDLDSTTRHHKDRP